MNSFNPLEIPFVNGVFEFYYDFATDFVEF